jgi:tetratricopeptide (TPR) repeat protein
MSNSKKLQKEGVNAFHGGDYETAMSKFEAAYAAAQEEGNAQRQTEILNDLGVIRKQTGNLEGAFEALEMALEQYQERGDKKGEAQVLGNLGMVEEAAEQYEDAVQSYLDSAALFEELGEHELAMYSWQALSRLRLRQKEWIAAIAAYEEGISHLPDRSMKKKMLEKLLKLPTKMMGNEK